MQELTVLGTRINSFLRLVAMDFKGLAMAFVAFFAAAQIFNEVNTRNKVSEGRWGAALQGLQS